MDFTFDRPKCFIAKHFLRSLIIFIISSSSCNLYGALITRSPFYHNSTFYKTISQKEVFIKGRITQSATNTPVCFADISNSAKTLYTKSNSEGEFVLGPVQFPVSLIIRKFGFKEETLTINDASDQVFMSLSPIEVHSSFSGMKKPLRYDMIFRKAIENLRSDYNPESTDDSQRELVYCRISSSIDSTFNSLFESYAQMNVSSNGLVDNKQLISRFAAEDEIIPGLTGNQLDFKIDPYINLPIMVEQSITRKGYFLQDRNLIAVIRVDLDKTINSYYINVADTSVVFITSRFLNGKKERIPWTREVWQSNKNFSAEISLSHPAGNREEYTIDWVSTNEEFSLIMKNKSLQTITKSAVFVVMPDSSVICNAVRDQVAHEALTEIRKQINFRAKYLRSDKYSVFDSETEKLLSKPYRPDFWAGNSLLLPVKNELRQIAIWEKSNRFYSQDRLPSANEIFHTDSLPEVINKNLVTVENVYIETDRSDYLAGDTIWFSAFVLDNFLMDSTSLSRILYADLINSDNIPEKHLKLIIINGRAHGEFVLKKDTKNGIFRLRAYTQYMRNFQGEYLFEKEIPVHQSDFTKMILVNPLIRRSSAGDSVELHIKTILPDEYQTQDKKLEVLARLNDTLSVRKTFAINKILDEKMGFFVSSSLSCPFVDIRLILSGQTVISEQRLSIPLKSGINLQFFPESGKMVDGIETVVAFKAADNKGYPAEIEAVIIDEKNNIIKHISGDSTGVGKFYFTPEYNHKYRAVVNLNGNKYSFSLPEVEPKGYILNFNADSGDIVIKNNQNSVKVRHYLLVSVRGAVYASIDVMPKSKPLKVHIPLPMYPKGIVQVTLYDSLFRPLAERLIFNNRQDEKIFIKVEPDKQVYRPREKVTLTVSVTDGGRNPVRSSLSLAVTDASKNDPTLNSADIETYLFLASELKGEIDYRLINLADTTPEGNIRRDLVMMTQGWRNYLWNSIRYKDTYKVLYPVEKGLSICGSVYSMNTPKSFSGCRINYFDFNSGFNGITKVDENNKFRIEIPFHYNTQDYFIQSRNNKDRVENLSFVLDTFPMPVIPYRKNDLPFTYYKAGYFKTLEKKFSETDSTNRLIIKYMKLPEVNISAKSDRSGYSAPDKMIDLNKQDPTGKKYASLFQMIYQEFGEKAFAATGFGTKGKAHNPILVVDGAPMTVATCPPCYDFDSYNWASSIPIGEIKEVKFYEAQSKYSQWLTPPPPLSLPPDPKIYLPVVSIKTDSKSYRGNPRGAIMIGFQGIYMAREFYQPDHENKNIQSHDNRSTIYWNPDIQTDSTGTAKVSFYNSDLNSKALIKISCVSFFLKDAGSSFSGYMSH